MKKNTQKQKINKQIDEAIYNIMVNSFSDGKTTKSILFHFYRDGTKLTIQPVKIYPEITDDGYTMKSEVVGSAIKTKSTYHNFYESIEMCGEQYAISLPFAFVYNHMTMSEMGGTCDEMNDVLSFEPDTYYTLINGKLGKYPLDLVAHMIEQLKTF